MPRSFACHPRRVRHVAETVGWLADKLSIIELKIYHMTEQAQRPDVTDAFREHYVLKRVPKNDAAYADIRE